MQQPYWLDTHPIKFPPSNLALTDPDGLLAVGGDLTPEWLLKAYSKGIFPWFNEDEHILWWTPNPRSVLFIADLKVRKSLKQAIRKQQFKITLDTAFSETVQNCAKITRPGQDGTWISDRMYKSYQKLHDKGHAHSVEVWQKEKLVGGLYGVAIGKVFFGESMFSKASDASKIALVALCGQLSEWGFNIIDTQVETAHLKSLGAQLITRTHFESLLKADTVKEFLPQKWHLTYNWEAVYLNTYHNEQ